MSNVLGVIWLNPSPDWVGRDYAERILHEYVHQCLFLDQMVNTLFTRDVPGMSAEDALTTSAILKVRRSYDKSFHSAFVAVTLAQFFNKVNITDRATTLLGPSTLSTISELRSKPYLLTDHGKDVIEELYTLVSETPTAEVMQ